MLVRRPDHGSEIAIRQEQHALVSGVLAAAWRPALDPRLIAAITLHDAPWHNIDREPRRSDDGGLIDFVAFPLDERVSFYAEGIDDLEHVDPYVAYMVSLHYASFAGIAKVEAFRTTEAQRRKRLEPLLGPLKAHTEAHLRWLQYFDVFSLHVCLTGLDVATHNLPVWLRETSTWSRAPDGRDLQLGWTDANTLQVKPWPFAGDELSIPIAARRDAAALTLDVRLVRELPPNRRHPEGSR